MSYDLIIEGKGGARKVRRGALPRRGEWIGLELEEAWCWLPVLEVGYVLSSEEAVPEGLQGCDYLHESAEGLVFSSLALAVRVEPQCREEEAVKCILPPTRWPLGGRLEPEGN